MTKTAFAVKLLLNNVLKDDNLNKIMFINAFIYFINMQNKFSSS